MFLETNSYTCLGLPFLNEILEKQFSLNNVYIKPVKNLSLVFRFGEVLDNEDERPNILKRIASIAAQTEVFSVELRQAIVVETKLALRPNSGAKELAALCDILVREKIIDAFDNKPYLPYTTLLWIGHLKSAQNVVSEINEHEFLVKWQINEIAMIEYNKTKGKFYTSNLFPLKVP